MAQTADLAKAVAPPSGSSGINIYNVNNPHVSGTQTFFHKAGSISGVPGGTSA